MRAPQPRSVRSIRHGEDESEERRGRAFRYRSELPQTTRSRRTNFRTSSARLLPTSRPARSGQCSRALTVSAPLGAPELCKLDCGGVMPIETIEISASVFARLVMKSAASMRSAVILCSVIVSACAGETAEAPAAPDGSDQIERLGAGLI